MRAVLVFVGLSTLLSCLSLAAGADFPRPDVREWSLKNGLDVVYVGVHKIPVVSVQVWYHVGSKDEARNRRGSAHMFEHMMFKGTRSVPPEDHARLLDKLGGSINAFTTEDVTAFHNTLPRQYMDFGMQLEAERMQHLLFRKKMVDTEREVVKEEIRQRENNPIAKALERYRELAFVNHPYAWDAGGRIEDLDATTPADLEKFYKTYYQPNNAVLIVVGDVQEAEVRTSAERWFGAIPRAPEPPRPARDFPEPEQTQMRHETVDPGQIGLIIGGFKVPAARHVDFIPLMVLSSVLSAGESARLHQRIVRKDKVGAFTGAYLEALEDPGLMLIFGAHLAPDQAQKLEAALIDEVVKLQKAPISQLELSKAKNQLAAQFIFQIQTLKGLTWYIGLSKFLNDDAKAWLDEYDRILAVTAADIQRVAKTYLTRKRLTVVAVPPGGAAGAKGGE